MAVYKIDSRSPDNARTEAYRFTVPSKDDASLLALKEDCKRHNKKIKAHLRVAYEIHGSKVFERPWNQIMRVSLMARGPRTAHAVADYGYARAYDQNLPHEYATHFDVYYGSDSYAMYRFQYQLENGLTPGQHAIIDREQRKLWDADNKMLAVLGAAGIARVGDRNGTRFVNSTTHTPSALRRNR